MDVGPDGNLYVLDTTSGIGRNISLMVGMINVSTHAAVAVAGTGLTGDSGIGGPALQARIRGSAIALDPAGNLYIGGGDEITGVKIRKVNAPLPVRTEPAAIE